MNMVEVKVSELEGAALDWAVSKAIGEDPQYYPAAGVWGLSIYHYEVLAVSEVEAVPRYSTDWAQGGPMIEKYRLHLHCDEPSASFLQSGMRIGYTAKTVLIAASRAIVAAKLGDTVSVPRDLL